MFEFWERYWYLCNSKHIGAFLKVGIFRDECLLMFEAEIYNFEVQFSGYRDYLNEDRRLADFNLKTTNPWSKDRTR